MAVNESIYPTKEFYFDQPRSRELWLIGYGMIPDMYAILGYRKKVAELTMSNHRLATYLTVLDKLDVIPDIHNDLIYSSQPEDLWKSHGPIITAEYALGSLRSIIKEGLPTVKSVKYELPEFITNDENQEDFQRLIITGAAFSLPKNLQQWVQAIAFTSLNSKLLGIDPHEL